MKKEILEKNQGILQLNYSFYGVLFFSFNFDITMTYFLSSQFSFSMSGGQSSCGDLSRHAQTAGT